MGAGWQGWDQGSGRPAPRAGGGGGGDAAGGTGQDGGLAWGPNGRARARHTQGVQIVRSPCNLRSSSWPESGRAAARVRACVHAVAERLHIQPPEEVVGNLQGEGGQDRGTMGDAQAVRLTAPLHRPAAQPRHLNSGWQAACPRPLDCRAPAPPWPQAATPQPGRAPCTCGP